VVTKDGGARPPKKVITRRTWDVMMAIDAIRAFSIENTARCRDSRDWRRPISLISRPPNCAGNAIPAWKVASVAGNLGKHIEIKPANDVIDLAPASFGRFDINQQPHDVGTRRRGSRPGNQVRRRGARDERTD